MGNGMFEDVRKYGKADLAGTYRSTAGTQAPVDGALLARLLADVAAQGFVIVPDVVPAERIDEIRVDVLPRLAHGGGRNDFEGFATRRLYAVIAKTLVCNELVEHPLVLGLLDRLLEPNYLLSQLQVIDILPGEAAQPLHPDDAFYPWPRPRPPLGVATIWPLDDFTEENGATVVIPGSHLWDDRMPTPEESAAVVPAVMTRGSVLLFLGTLWHGGGANRGMGSRACVTAQYCAPWCRQQENFSLSVPRDRVRQCSEHVQRLLGYSIHPPFMGFVDGMHPKRLLSEDVDPAR